MLENTMAPAYSEIAREGFCFIMLENTMTPAYSEIAREEFCFICTQVPLNKSTCV
jgi:hypothetical protein